MLDWCSFLYLCSRGGSLQEPLLLPEAACNNASNIHWLLQILALQVLFNPA